MNVNERAELVARAMELDAVIHAARDAVCDAASDAARDAINAGKRIKEAIGRAIDER